MWVYILREIPFLNIAPELGVAGGVTTPWYCCIPSKRVVFWVYILREIPFLNIAPELGFAGGVTCRRPFIIVPYTCTFVQYRRTFGAPD